MARVVPSGGIFLWTDGSGKNSVRLNFSAVSEGSPPGISLFLAKGPTGIWKNNHDYAGDGLALPWEDRPVLHPDGIRTGPAGLKVRGLSASWLHPKAFLSAFPENAGGQDHAPGIRAQQPILAACEGLCEALVEGAAPGTLRRLWAVWGLCGRRLTRRLFWGVSPEGKAAWEAVPEQQFCGSNPAVSDDRKKY